MNDALKTVWVTVPPEMLRDPGAPVRRVPAAVRRRGRRELAFGIGAVCFGVLLLAVGPLAWPELTIAQRIGAVVVSLLGIVALAVGALAIHSAFGLDRLFATGTLVAADVCFVSADGESARLAFQIGASLSEVPTLTNNAFVTYEVDGVAQEAMVFFDQATIAAIAIDGRPTAAVLVDPVEPRRCLLLSSDTLS